MSLTERMARCGHNPHSTVKRFVGITRPAIFAVVQTPDMSVGQRIRTLREQSGLTQAALSAEIGVSRSHLTKIETGRDPPGRDTLMAIATHFDVSLDWLAKGIGDQRPARALNEAEALLLHAFRRLPAPEAELHLQLMLKRVRKDDA
jgi:transcriptional regulator with XRE-family HTH domain